MAHYLNVLVRAMRKTLVFSIAVSLGAAISLSTAVAQQKKVGNPVISGWYADPEAAIFGKYTGYTLPIPTNMKTRCSLTPFPQPIWRWKKHRKILDTWRY